MPTCERCGQTRCIDKRFVPYEFLLSYSHYHDCPRYYGLMPIDYTGNGRRAFDVKLTKAIKP